jgi:hypothetical protein
MHDDVMTWMDELDACSPAKRWLQEQEMPEAAWRDCDRGDWMIWLLVRLCATPEGRQGPIAVLVEHWRAEIALAGVKAPRAAGEAIELVERWCAGEGVSEAELRAAAAAAADAYADAYAAVYADAAYAAAYAADAVYAAAAAAYAAAKAAVYAAAAAVYADAAAAYAADAVYAAAKAAAYAADADADADADARRRSYARLADRVRQRWPEPPRRSS